MSCQNSTNFAFNEMMTHIPLCTHKEAKNILVVGDVETEFKQECAKHNYLSVVYGDSSNIVSKNEKELDVIIITTPNTLDTLLLANINRVLKDDGIIAFVSENFGQNEQKLKDDLLLISEHFWIAMPYKFGHTTAILASKKYHPTADIILQRSDLLNDLSYYSSEIHLASFVFPASIHRDLTGIAKR